MLGIILFLLFVFGAVWLYNKFFGCACKDKVAT